MSPAPRGEEAFIMTIKVWGRLTSGRTLKVLWALAELGLDYELIPASATMGPDGSVAKGNIAYGVVDTPMYLAMNPNATVPTIDDGGFILWESNSIVRYLGMKYNPQRFYANDIYVFASASRWLDFENNNLIPPQHEIELQLHRLPENQHDPAKLEAACKTLARELAKIESQLTKTKYIAADWWTMGDIGIGLRVHRWYLFDIARPTMPNIARYYERIKTRPAFAAIADRTYHQS
jgi:glutathione S-transferase